MGRDKAFIEIEGVPLWQRQLGILERLGPAEIFLAGPPRPEWSSAGCTIIPDAQNDAGPLAGLVAGLRRCSTSLLLALAVDLPHMTSNYLRELLELCAPEKGVVPASDHFEPLAAVYPITSLALAERLLQSGCYSLQDFACRCLADGFAIERPIRHAKAGFFLNMNTPADLNADAP